MKQQAIHRSEDKLLEFAYGELPPDEAQSIAGHLQGCSRCSDALEAVQGVRRTMSLLEPEPAPAAGLDSLLAYAQQSARRAAAGPAPSRAPWRRWVYSIAGVASLALVVVVGTIVTKSMRAPEALAEKRLSVERRQELAPQASEPAPVAAEGQAVAQAQMPPPAKAAASKEVEDVRHEAPAANYFDARSDKRLQKLAATPPLAKGDVASNAAPGEQLKDEGKHGAKLDSIQQAYQPAPKPQAQSISSANDDDHWSQRTRMPAPPPQEIAKAKKSSRRIGGSWEGSPDGAGSGGPGSFDAPSSAPNEGLSERVPTTAGPSASRGSGPALGGAVANAPADEDRRGLSLGGSMTGTARPVAQAPERKAEEADDFERAPAVAKSAPVQELPMAASAAPAPSREAAAAAAQEPRDSAAQAKEEEQLEDRRLGAEAEVLRKEISATRDPVKLAPLLGRLCGIEITLGYIQPTSCRRLEKEFASTPEGARAKRILERQRTAPAAPAVKD